MKITKVLKITNVEILIKTSGQFSRAAKHTYLLSTENVRLAKTGYQPNCHVMYRIYYFWPVLALHFVQQINLLKQYKSSCQNLSCTNI